MPTGSGVGDLSVVVPAYGARDGALARALRSLVSVEGVQVVVVDDASPDGSVESICADFPSVRCVRRPTNGGVAAAQNTGLDAVDTPWVCFLHSDDEFVPERVGVQLDLARRHKGAVVGGACAYDSGIAADPLPEATDDDFLLHRFGIHVSPYVFPTELARSVRFDPELRAWEDWDLFFRLQQAGVEFVTTDQPTAIVHLDAAERLTESPVNGIALRYLYEKHRIADRSSQVRSLWQFKIGRRLDDAGDHDEARTWVLRSLRSEPWHPRRVRTLLSWMRRRG